MDRAAGFVAVFEGAESDLSVDTAIGVAGRSNDRFTSIHALPHGKTGSDGIHYNRESGEACDCQHRRGSRGYIAARRKMVSNC